MNGVPAAARGRAALALAIALLASYLPFASARLHDWRAFYCAGRAIDMRADPYREEPLGACERTARAAFISAEADGVTIPAPLPGYALAPFALAARLPLGWALGLWLILSAAALAAAVLLLADALRIARGTAAVIVALPAAVVAMPLGQPEPFVVAAMGAAAWAAVRGRPVLAACAVLPTAFDPSVALALGAALAVGMPRTRAPLAIGLAVLAAISLLTVGWDANVEYVTRVLPAHAAANVAERSQFSAAHFAWVVGAPPAVALDIGRLWYAVSVALGIWAALRLRARYGAAALVVVPAAFAVFGGLYVHFSQLILALPAFVWLAARGEARSTPPFALAIPWFALAAYPPAALALPVLAERYAAGFGTSAWRRLGLASALALVALFACALVLVSAHVPEPAFEMQAAAGALVQDGWQRYVAQHDAHPTPLMLLAQAPTVAAFTWALASLFRTALTRNASTNANAHAFASR